MHMMAECKREKPRRQCNQLINLAKAVAIVWIHLKLRSFLGPFQLCQEKNITFRAGKPQKTVKLTLQAMGT